MVNILKIFNCLTHYIYSLFKIRMFSNFPCWCFYKICSCLHCKDWCFSN